MKFYFFLFLLIGTLCQQVCSLSSSNPKEIRRAVATKPKSPKVSPDVSTKEEVTQVVQNAKASDPSDDTVDTFIRSEYKAWVLQHNKTTDDKRFEIFKGNFLATLKAYESTGKYHALNKFADMTPEEYKSAPAPVDDVDAYVKTEYKAWAEQYGKRADDKRYAIFKENFLMTMKIFEETGKFNALNEHGDMTKEEFIRFQTRQATAPSAAPSQQLSSSSEMPTLPPGPWTFTPVTPRSSSDVMKSSSSSSSEWENQGWSNPPARMPTTQPDPYPSYSRPSSMTFTPVSPKSTSDVLNKGSSSSNEWGGQQWNEQSGGEFGGAQWNTQTSTSNSEWGGQQQWTSSTSSGEWEQQWGSPGTINPTRHTTSDSYASYSRPSSMTFTPVTPKSTSDVLNKGSSSSTGGDWGGQERGPSSSGTSFAQPSNSFSSAEFSRPSSMTFTPITPRSSSDVLNKGSSSSSSWGGEEWGSSMKGSMSSSTSYAASNPSGATFKPITPTSTSDLLNGKSSGNDTTQWGRSSPSSMPGSYSSRSKQVSNKNKRGNFSYMPKATVSQEPSRPLEGFNPRVGNSEVLQNRRNVKSSANANGSSRTRKSTSYIPDSANGNSGNGSLWDKMASAAMDAFTGATRSSSSTDRQTIKSDQSSYSVRPGQRTLRTRNDERRSASSLNDSTMSAPYSGNSYLNRMGSGAENFGTPRSGRGP